MSFCHFFFSVELDDVFKQSILKDLQQEKADKVCVCVHISMVIISPFGNVNISSHSSTDPNFPEAVRDAK